MGTYSMLVRLWDLHDIRMTITEYLEGSSIETLYEVLGAYLTPEDFRLLTWSQLASADLRTVRPPWKWLVHHASENNNINYVLHYYFPQLFRRTSFLLDDATIHWWCQLPFDTWKHLMERLGLLDPVTCSVLLEPRLGELWEHLDRKSPHLSLSTEECLDDMLPVDYWTFSLFAEVCKQCDDDQMFMIFCKDHDVEEQRTLLHLIHNEKVKAKLVCDYVFRNVYNVPWNELVNYINNMSNPRRKTLLLQEFASHGFRSTYL